MTSMSLVNSILNDQQSRNNMADTVKYPTPPLIGPRIEALSRYLEKEQLRGIICESTLGFITRAGVDFTPAYNVSVLDV